MTIHHIVFFRFPERNSDIIQQAHERLSSMQGRVAAQKLAVGEDFDRSERAWDLVLVTEFVNDAQFEAYKVDPYHQEVIAWLRSVNTTTSVVDYRA